MATRKVRKVRVTFTFDQMVLARARWVCKKLKRPLARLISRGLEQRVRQLEVGNGLVWGGQKVRLRAGRPRNGSPS